MLLLLQFLRLIFTCPLREKTAQHAKLGSLFHPLIKKTRNNTEEKASSSDIVPDVLNMAESVTAKLDRIMEHLETLSLIENRLNSMASTMANIESTLSRLDADVMMHKEGAGKREKRIADLETLIDYNEDDVAELQKNLYDPRDQLDKCKKDLLYLEGYNRRAGKCYNFWTSSSHRQKNCFSARRHQRNRTQLLRTRIKD